MIRTSYQNTSLFFCHKKQRQYSSHYTIYLCQVPQIVHHLKAIMSLHYLHLQKGRNLRHKLAHLNLHNNCKALFSSSAPKKFTSALKSGNMRFFRMYNMKENKRDLVPVFNLNQVEQTYTAIYSPFEEMLSEALEHVFPRISGDQCLTMQ